MIDNYNELVDYLNLRNKSHSFNFYSEYLDKLPASIKVIIETERFLKPNHLSHDVCKKLFATMAIKTEPQFIFDSNNIEISELLCYYLRSDSKFTEFNNEYSISKGIMILGSLGTGKTILLKTISNFLSIFEENNYNYRPGFRIIPSHRMSANFIKHGYDYFDNPSLTSENVLSDNLGIDDIGAENKINYYGTQINVIGELMLRRYDKFQNQRKGGLFCTTNLNGEGIKEFYGERVHDRLIEMVNPIILTGKSRRK